MNDNNISKLIANIVYIEDKKKNEKIEYASISFTLVSSKWSNTKVSIYKLIIDDNIINRNNSYRLSYKCISCDHINIVNLNNIVRKMNRNIIDCNYCKNLNLEKRDKQSAFMKSNNLFDGSYVKTKNFLNYTLEEQIDLSNNAFQSMETEFQFSYFRKHMPKQEFDRLRSTLISFQNKKYTNISDWEYIETFKTNNQTKFNPYLYNREKDLLEKIQYIEYKCMNCNSHFINRDLHIQKNKYKIFCKDCNFTNNIFKIRKTTNIKGKGITYQSKLELKFIQLCNKNGIEIVDGPKIDYTFNDKNRKYKVDFFIPKLNLLIEIKDHHHWHKKNLKSGLFDSKMGAVNSLIEKGVYNEIKVIYSNKLAKSVEELIHS